MEEDGMVEELQRLLSFESWPPSSTVYPTILAKNGFHFTGEGDEVRCFSCKCTLRGLKEDGDLEREHSKASPSCPLLTETDTQNVRMERNPDFDRQGRNLLAENPGNGHLPQLDPPLGPPNNSPNSWSLHSRNNVAVNPNIQEIPGPNPIRSEEERLTTFGAWPSTQIVTPRELAKAGFVFLGPFDRVRCQFCQGVLHQWEAGDVAMSEHRKHFPHCPLVRGNDVGNVPFTDPTEALIDPIANFRPFDTVGDRNSERLLGIDYTVDPREIKARLDTPIVRAVLKMGFSRDMVKQCILHRLRTHGDDFRSAESLLDAVYSMEEVGTQQTPVTTSEEEPTVSKKPESPGHQGTGSSKKYAVFTETRKPEVHTQDINPGVSHINSEETEALRQENQSLKEDLTCKVCMDEEINIVFLPCGHLVCCSTCAPNLRKCPICRALIRGSVRTQSA